MLEVTEKGFNNSCRLCIVIVLTYDNRGQLQLVQELKVLSYDSPWSQLSY